MSSEGKLVAIRSKILKSNLDINTILLPYFLLFFCRYFTAIKHVGMRGVEGKGWGEEWII